MQKYLVLAALFYLLSNGCSSTTLDHASTDRLPTSIESWAVGKDPLSVEFRLNEMYKAAPSDEMEWWTLYNQAKLWMEENPAKSCANFKTLSTKSAFPLAPVSLLRSLEVCAPDEPGLPTLEDVLSKTSEPWLQEIARHTVLARAIRVGNREMEMRMSAEVADYRSLQSDKIKLLERAIELARVLKRESDVAEYQEKLVRIAPRFKTNPQPADFLAVAADLRQARLFERARQMYERAIASAEIPDGDKMKAFEGIRLAYKNERKVDAYLAANARMMEFARVRFNKNPKDRYWADKFHDAGTLLARAIWTEKTVAESQNVLDKLEADLGKNKEADEINWIRARMHEEAGRFAEAVKLLEKAATPGNPNRALTEKIIWYKAWNLRKIGRHEHAIEALRYLTKEYGSGTSRSRNQYWIGKSLLALKQIEAANSEFEELIRIDPLSYYTLLSYRELNRDLPAENLSDDESKERRPWPGQTDSPFEARADHDYIEWLISLGESRIGQQFLDYYFAKHGQKSPTTTAGRETLKYYARSGNFKALFAKIQSFPPEVRDRILDEEPSLLFPQPFTEHLDSASRKFGVERELAHSIMRQESSFDPLARSPADAFGLMQMIPEAAKKVERHTGIKITNPEQLYKPEINLPVGTAFVRLLMNQFDEQFIPTVASYNANEKAIRGWIRTRYRGDTIEFIEDIPYDETKTYVKLVMRNYVFYRRINSGGRNLPFPAWCLDSLHALNN